MTNDELLTSEIWRFSRIWRALRVDREDLAQDVRLSLLRRPVDEGAPDNHRRITIRQHVIDALRLHGWRDRQPGYTGAKRAVLQMPAWSDLSLQDPSHTPDPPDPWLRTRLDVALRALPPRQARVVWATVVEGAELREAGATHGRSMQWAWQQRTRGLAALKEALCASR